METNTTETVVNLLWTGGWDSTYALIEKSRQPLTVRPIYICDNRRKSQQLEIKAMKNILLALMKKKESQAVLLPIEFVNKDEIPQNPKITQSYNTIFAETSLGAQQEWIARLAFKYGNLEIGTEAGNIENSPSRRAINKYCALVKSPFGYFEIDKEKSTDCGNDVFGNLRFPIIDKTEMDMKENIQRWGYQDIMKLIWFCHNPTFLNNPCGLCHPCEVKMENNMEDLLTEAARWRYRHRHSFAVKLLRKGFYAINAVRYPATSLGKRL